MKPHSQLPLVIAVTATIGGGVSAALRLREWYNGSNRTVYIICRGDPSGLPEPPDFVFETSREVARWLRRLGSCVLVPNWIWSLYGVAGHLRRSGQYIVVVGYCRSDADEYYSRLTSWAHVVDVFVGVSQRCADVLSARLGGTRVHVLASPVHRPDSLKRPYSIAPLRLGYCGRVVQQYKRVLDLPPLAAKLLERDIDFTLDIIGIGADVSRLLEELQTVRHLGRVRLLGTIDQRDLASMWLERDVVLLTSDVEGLSCALLEAMAAGAVPVVTRGSGGIEHLVDNGRNGFVVEVGDLSEMADRIAGLSYDRQRLSDIGHAAFDSSAPYAIDRFVETWETLLDGVTGGANE